MKEFVWAESFLPIIYHSFALELLKPSNDSMSLVWGKT
jgi:hypothetical protein